MHKTLEHAWKGNFKEASTVLKASTGEHERLDLAVGQSQQGSSTLDGHMGWV